MRSFKDGNASTNLLRVHVTLHLLALGNVGRQLDWQDRVERASRRAGGRLAYAAMYFPNARLQLNE